MKNFISLLLISVSLLLLSSCHKDDEPEVTMRHALLFYMVCENSLMSIGNDDVMEILSGKSQLKDDEEIILYIDGSSNPAIYQITNKTEGSCLRDLTPVYTYSENYNSCSGAQLTDFLSYVKNNFPVDVYSLVLWSHGYAWMPSSYSGDSQNFAKNRSFGIDNGKNSNSNVGNEMSISELHTALQSFGKKFNYIFFDACYMQCIEVDYELRDVASYIIASPAEIPGPGADYCASMTSFFDETSYIKTIPEAYYNTYKVNNSNEAFSEGYGVLISTVDCSKLDALMLATKNVVNKYSDQLLNASYDDVNDYFIYDYWRSQIKQPDFYDMKGIFMTLIPESDNQNFMAAFQDAVPYAYATTYFNTEFYKAKHVILMPFEHDQYGGVTMYIPLKKYSTDGYADANAFFVNGYKQSSWAKDTGLSEL